METKILIGPALIASLIICIGGLFSFLLSRFSYSRDGFFGRVRERQTLANMIVQNRFYTEKKSADGSRLIRKFPKIYYRQRKGKIISIYFPLDGNKDQKKFLEIGSMLESMFFADNMAILAHKGYVEYQLFTNVLRSRISVTDVKGKKNSVLLMKGVEWDFDSLPHLLIGGGTGGGKTFLLMSLILGLLECGEVEICDPKDSDLMALGRLPVFQGKVFTGKAIIGCLRRAQEEMLRRFKYMTESKSFSMGKNYSHYGLKPKFIVIDEWAAFITEMESEKNGRDLINEIYGYLTQLILKARQAGVFIILAMQRPDAMYLKGSLRDNFMFRMSVGDLSSDGYNMIFGEINRQKKFKSNEIKGHGYVGAGGKFCHEFYSPLVPEDFNFYEVFSRFGEQETFDMTIVDLTENEQETLLQKMN